MDRTDVEIEEYEEIIGDLRWHEGQRETEEARAVSSQEPTLSNPEILMTHTERLILRSAYESSAGNIHESHPVVVTHHKLLPARRRPQGLVVISVCLCVCVSVCAHCVCPQDILRTGSWITTKFGGWDQGVNL